ncbi:site-specific recombinase [Herbiconiux sp. YIM B11900]|uniref:site-specific recombinase n=1 Tax=Herbiconiux sp. YIM B11900 TaxID=3404131 RepID=UPI003F852403
MVAKIRVHWPDGAICGACFTAGVRTRGVCASCGDHRLLPGRTGAGGAICRDCAGITTNMTCDRCGTEAERFRHGNCIRCILHDELSAILRPNDPPDLRLRRLVETLAASARPESIHTWMRGRGTALALAQLGNRTVTLDHASFDSRSSPALEHIRDILIHHHMLPALPDKHLAGFERWLQVRLSELAPRPHVHQPVEQFARWHHLKRLHSPDPAQAMVTATLTARQEITETEKFLIWLDVTHGLTVAELRQGHVDEYLSTGTSTRNHIRTFLHWNSRNQGSHRRVTAPYRKALSNPLITQEQWIELVANCLAFDQVTLSTRIAGLIQLLWAQPLNKITRLTVAAIQTRPTGMRIQLGENASDIPESITEVFWAYLTDRGNQQTVNTGTDWLFPGYRAGHPISPNTLSIRLRVLGIDAQRARNTALRDLAHQLDARSLADLLDYSPQTLALHAARAGTPMSDYIDLKRRDQSK